MLRRENFLRWVPALTACFAMSACGAPNLAEMRPQHAKATAEVLVVGTPPGWTDDAVKGIEEVAGVVTQVRRVSSASMGQVLDQKVQGSHPGLLVVVDANGSPTAIRAWASSHPNIRLEWVGGMPSAGASADVPGVRRVTVQPVAAAYCLGWGAGQLAAAASAWVPTVGWLEGSGSLPASVIQAALAGLYSGNPTVQLRPVTLAPPGAAGQSGDGGASALAGGVAGGAPPAGTNPQSAGAPLPKVVLTARELTPAEWALVRAEGVTVISLCPQPAGTGGIGAPALPGPGVVADDLRLFAAGRWQAGWHAVDAGSLTQWHSIPMPDALRASLDSLELALQGGTIQPSTVWNQMPADIRTQWGAVAGGGIA
ncbi:hypothetical protein [Alicyclobacillus sp.]|uniref:hypothetical protein n=1 Tax=Alicyclobacillus sp. TaxID=61169 RepID=UPI0025C34CE4|nr:hypothetical protein [Alicyclobacillus sp.]MCL6516228.1 hypothetical protein [Alicyclobacillus sp.]